MAKTKTPRQKMPERDPRERAGDFLEVPLGFTAEMAVAEAARCLQCRKPKCVEGCPAEVDVSAFIRLVVEREFSKSLGVLESGTKPWSLYFPYDVALGADRVLNVVEYEAGRVTRLSLDGELIGRFGTTGKGPNHFATPWGIAVSNRGSLLVADTGNARIVELEL